jgi:penicillin V acylase-like amidase (Ntn superfamily)
MIAIQAQRPPVEIDGVKLQSFGQGSGMLGLPGDFTPPSRFVRGAVFSATALPSPNSEKGVLQECAFTGLICRAGLFGALMKGHWYQREH